MKAIPVHLPVDLINQRYGSTRKELMAIINDYIQWYNEERIQEGLGYLSPANFFKKMNLETVAN